MAGVYAAKPPKCARPQEMPAAPGRQATDGGRSIIENSSFLIEKNNMVNRIIHRLFRMFTGALLGYIWGWIWGWSLFDPNSDLWALGSGLGAIGGLLAGILFRGEKFDALTLSATFGLFLSWIVRTLLFGNVPGGWGILVLAGGALLGALFSRRAGSSLVIILMGALYAGFFGGFLIDVILLDILLGWVQTRSLLTQAPIVIVCGIAGGIGTALWINRPGRRKP
jgi:hypothetical protein